MKPTRTSSRAPLPLREGERLSQEEFHRLYQQCPEDVKFELIEGVVHMASPLKRPHGTSHFELTLVLALYKARTPGVEGADNMTTILGQKKEPQPDLLLRLVEECGGQSKYDADDYLVGAPELVAEVADSSESIDLKGKRRDYLAAGVQEYLVFCVQQGQIHWFHFPSKRKLKPDRHGVWKSRVFPGLWLDGPALIARDSARLIATVEQGLASAEHAAFVELLARRGGR